MPIFEYRCRECGATFERILSSSAPKPRCTQCESPRVEQLLSVFAVSNASSTSVQFESGPCGACGAPRRGMCGE